MCCIVQPVQLSVGFPQVIAPANVKPVGVLHRCVWESVWAGMNVRQRTSKIPFHRGWWIRELNVPCCQASTFTFYVGLGEHSRTHQLQHSTSLSHTRTQARTLTLSHTRTQARTLTLSHARTPEDDENIWRESAFNSDWRNALYLASFVVNKIGSSKYNLHILFLTRTIVFKATELTLNETSEVKRF